MIDRFCGALLGLAIGDALGAPVEFKKRDSFTPVVDMQAGGVFNLARGFWTDDTSMALCLAHSLLELKQFDPKDQMARYLRWRDEGYLSSTGNCFDIGISTSLALSEFKKTGMPFCGITDPKKAGNGCLMRLAPIPMFFFPNKVLTIEMSGESARTTHGASECIEATQLFGAMIFEAINGNSKQNILLAHGVSTSSSLGIQNIAKGSYFHKTVDQIKSNGYVVNSLEAALWCFYTTECFEDAVLKAVNLGDDADTTAAICGQLAGAFYGIEQIPQHWLNTLYQHDMIMDISEKLHHKN